ncbi:MAG: hypothetical protein K5662_07420 [Lachnospiraceae bacterium]|nr:hypothetical protein [Lachnospiraceae bacterium]
MNFFSKLFRGQDEDFFNMELDEAGEEDFEWDWEHIMEDRQLFKMSDPLQRERYIRSLVEQVHDASAELDKLSYEYNVVTATLKDMDEIESLPPSEKLELQSSAQKILFYEGETSDYNVRSHAMTEEQFAKMERYENDMEKACKDMQEAEDFRTLIKNDLKKLDGEKHAYLYRKSEVTGEINNCRGMAIILVFSAILCVIMLLVLQFGFKMDTQIGYVIVVVAAAISIGVTYSKYVDASRELKSVYSGLNRIILLQNSVKIRYVNNTKLLDYLYAKYDTVSAKELKNAWDNYLKEKSERERYKINEKELSLHQAEFLNKLRKYQLSDVYAWLHNPRSVMEHKEMVELRHAHIIQRQKLRQRMDYNKRLATDGEKELKEFIRQYPQYSNEAMDMLNRYS